MSDRSIYQLKITLKDVKPPIWRRLLAPGDLTLDRLHGAFQITMGWTGTHLHQFTAGRKSYGPPDDMEDLPQLLDETGYRLDQVASRKGAKFDYEYDFGDGWEHSVVVEEILPEESGGQYPRCVEGERACPPEDSGGPWGYKDLLAALGNQKHPSHEEKKEWVGGEFDPELFDLEETNQALLEEFKPARKRRLKAAR